MSVRPIKLSVGHPALRRHAQERAKSFQNHLADSITVFAGSMTFVYVHVALFAVWMVLFEKSPWPTLTLVVSLEAIFLSTFILISQNRADEKRAVLAGQEWQSVQLEEKQNEQLLNLSQQILALSDAIHQLTVTHTGLTSSLAPAPPGATEPWARSDQRVIGNSLTPSRLKKYCLDSPPGSGGRSCKRTA